MKKFLSILGASLFALGFVGCSNELENSNNLSALLLNNSNSSSQTGTFTYESQASRSISVSDIKSAIVTLTGYDSNGNKFSKSSSAVSVSSGKPSSSITVSDVPVANNVVVTVKAYSDEAGSVEIQGQTIRTVTNITSGSNSASADWTTTIKGNVYNALCEGGVNTNTGLSAYSSKIETLTAAYASANVHAALVDVDAILSVVKANGELSTSASSYRKTPASLTITSYGYEGKTILIRDPLSSSVTAPANGQTVTISNILPGCWGLYVDGSLLKNITLSSGENQAVIGDPLTGHMVVFASASSAPRLWIWQVEGDYTDGEKVLGCDWNSRPTMTAATTLNNNEGWYMYDLTANGCSYTDGIAFKIVLDSGSDIVTGKTSTFWYDAAGLVGTAGTFYDSDPTQVTLSNDATLASISVNGSALTGFASGTTSYSTEIASSVTSAVVTAVANDDGASLTVSPSASTEIEEGESKNFTITVLAEDGTTTKTYTVSVTRKETVVDDVSLSSVKVNGNAASLSGSNYSYTKTGSDESLTISSVVATPTDASASVSYSTIPSTVASGSPASVTITVTNGSKSATYTLTISYTYQSSPEYYWTNKNGYGNSKTISGLSSWSEDDKIIQSVACDTPRCWLGGHEYPDPDLYAMFAAWDDTNLYLLIEIPNVDDADAVDNDKCYAGSQFLPMGIVLNTGKRTAGNGCLESGFSVWQASKLYSWTEGIDTMLMFHPRLGIGEPSIFKTQNDGTFTYESSVAVASQKQYCIGFATAGVEREIYFNKSVSTNMWAAVVDEDGNWGGKSSTDMSSYSYVDYMSSAYGKKMSSYQVTIPLASLDIDKAYIESTGISVGCFSTYGASAMDCLPWDPVMIDNASEGYSCDPSSSKEKEDADEISASLARIGHAK